MSNRGELVESIQRAYKKNIIILFISYLSMWFTFYFYLFMCGGVCMLFSFIGIECVALRFVVFFIVVYVIMFIFALYIF